MRPHTRILIVEILIIATLIGGLVAWALGGADG